MKIDPEKDFSGFIDFRDVQVVHTFTGWVTRDLYFKVTTVFNVEYLEYGTRQSYYNGTLTVSYT